MQTSHNSLVTHIPYIVEQVIYKQIRNDGKLGQGLIYLCPTTNFPSFDDLCVKLTSYKHNTVSCIPCHFVM